MFPEFGIAENRISHWWKYFFKEKEPAIACLTSVWTTFNMSTLKHDVWARYFGRNYTNLQTFRFLYVPGIRHVFQDRTVVYYEKINNFLKFQTQMFSSTNLVPMWRELMSTNANSPWATDPNRISRNNFMIDCCTRFQVTQDVFFIAQSIPCSLIL